MIVNNYTLEYDNDSKMPTIKIGVLVFTSITIATY